MRQVLRLPWHSFRWSRVMTSLWLYPSLVLVISALFALSALPRWLPRPFPPASSGSVSVPSGTFNPALLDPQAAAQHVGSAVAIRGCVQLEDTQHPSADGLAVGFVGELCGFLAGWARLAPLPMRHLSLCFSELYAHSMNRPLQAGGSASRAAEVSRGFCCSWVVAEEGWLRPSLRTPRGTNPKHRSFHST